MMHLYFAYGSNLDQGQMRDRCPDSELVDPSAYLDGYRLGFTWYSRVWSCGVADVVLADACKVWGFVYRLSDEDLEQLDYYENYPNSYTRFRVCVNSETGTYPDAWVYEVVNKSEFVPPSTLYISIIRSAAERYFPPDYLEAVDQINLA